MLSGSFTVMGTPSPQYALSPNAIIYIDSSLRDVTFASILCLVGFFLFVFFKASSNIYLFNAYMKE